MNILVVDDEIYVARALQKNMNWKQLGIDQMLMAFNVEKAKKIFEETEIDILITDIEMPRESGLDLLKWVREKNYQCKAICLTCHQEFKYAQKALQYQVSDYVLKPLDFQNLYKLISKVVHQIHEEQRQKEERNKGILWEYHQGKLESAFWRDLLKGTLEDDPEELFQEAERVNVSWDFNQQYQFLLFSVKRIYENAQEWAENEEQRHNSIYQIAAETFLEEEDMDRTGWFDRYHMWVILPAERNENLKEKLKQFIDKCYQRTEIGIVAYLDSVCFGEELHGGFQRLMEYDKENVSLEKGIFQTSFRNREQDTLRSGFYMELRNLLKGRKFDEARKKADAIWREEAYISSMNLVWNVIAGQYEICRCLEECQIAEKQFWDEAMIELWDKSKYSASMYKEWLKSALERIKNLYTNAKEERKVTGQIKEYVSLHIEEKISREDIAKYISFSVDHISRMFKKETGISLSEYIMEQKMERAKTLIKNREDSIGNIAIRLGYNNFSYFSEVFRRFTGVLPSEYRRISQTE